MARAKLLAATTAVALGAALACAGPASADPAGEIHLYGTVSGADTGLVAVAGTSPAIAGVDGAAPNYELAYDDGGQVAVAGSVQNGTLGLAIAPGTSPRIIGLAGSGYETVFQFTSSALTSAGTAGATINHLGMLAGTSPDIGYVPGGGFLETFDSNDNQPWTAGTDAGGRVEEPEYPKTDPAVASISGSYELVFEGADGDLWSDDSGGATDDKEPMAPGTSPDITYQPAGTYEIAFQGADHDLYVDNGTTATDTRQTMDPTGTPAITNLLGGGYEVAYRGADGNLCLYGSAGRTDTGLAVEAGTEPGIGGLPTGGYEVAYAAPATPTTPDPPMPIPTPPPITAPPVTAPGSAPAVASGSTRSTIAAPTGQGRGGRPLRTHLGMVWRFDGTHTRLQRLTIARLPAGGRITLRCAGAGCARAPRVSGTRAPPAPAAPGRCSPTGSPRAIG